MEMINLDKLVRNNILKIIEIDVRTTISHIADDKEYQKCLQLKLK